MNATADGAAAAPAERPAPDRPAAADPEPSRGRCCENCGTVLAGPYCSACGQRHHDHPVHSFRHFIREATEDATHADSRLWQTLIALLFRPGFLTREFLDGHRVRFLPPVRLYLVVSVIYFLLVGLYSQLSPPMVNVFPSNGQSYHLQYGRTPRHGGLGPVAQTPAQARRDCENSGTFIAGRGGWLARFGPMITVSCLAAVGKSGAERLTRSFEHNLERAMFLLLPLLALVMKPLYLRPPRHYVEHLLFFLHNHAFLFVVLGLGVIVRMITTSSWALAPLDVALTIYIPIYFYRAMRRVYGQGRWLTLGKLTTLGVAYFFLGLALFVVTFSYSFLML